ncbi:MAG: hypothetical protein VR73_07890 [Gammaproteobacteria bacterium BRH_c0]|nr:MAG: hypothetical protein VR73_07890 [Gammaproteobacteria bacterium BRH_c0]
MIQAVRSTLRICLVYALFAAVWIFFSDALLSTFIEDKADLARVQLHKGLWFVLATSALLYFG